MRGSGYHPLFLLCMALVWNSFNAHGQVLDQWIGYKLKNTTSFTQFATFYGHDNCQDLIEMAKHDPQVVLERFEDLDNTTSFVYRTSTYRIEIIIRKTSTGMDVARIYWYRG